MKGTQARKDSLTRGRHVVSGKVQEHLAPLFTEFIGMPASAPERQPALPT
ncbi:MAG: Holliday junction resolvase-like protein [Gaiellaceae bacterium]